MCRIIFFIPALFVWHEAQTQTPCGAEWRFSMNKITDRELSIYDLRANAGLTLKEIGEHFKISPSRVSYLFRQAQRKMSIIKREELLAEENKRNLLVNFTLGELDLLCRVLSDYQYLMTNFVRRSKGTESLEDDTDYSTAGVICDRLCELVETTRYRGDSGSDYSTLLLK